MPDFADKQPELSDPMHHKDQKELSCQQSLNWLVFRFTAGTVNKTVFRHFEGDVHEHLFLADDALSFCQGQASAIFKDYAVRTQHAADKDLGNEHV